MRLSELISRNIVEPTIGSIIGKFKGRPRRYTLFFEDILAEYIELCDESGKGELLREIGEKWSSPVVEQRIPNPLKKLPKVAFINLILRPIWVSNGVMDDIRATQKGNLITIETKNEGLTRITGKNELATGLYQGALSALFNVRVKLKNQNQSKQSCKYVFEITKEPFEIKSKDLGTYNKLNESPKIPGKTLKDLLREGILKLSKDNRIYFRGRAIGPIENTVFHLIGDYNLLIDKVPQISFDYFDELIDKNASVEKKLILIKNLLQAMGWGNIKFIIKTETKISTEIRNPPYGIQSEKDNWNFLINVILGYLWTIDKKFKIASVQDGIKGTLINYRIH